MVRSAGGYLKRFKRKAVGFGLGGAVLSLVLAALSGASCSPKAPDDPGTGAGGFPGGGITGTGNTGGVVTAGGAGPGSGGQVVVFGSGGVPNGGGTGSASGGADAGCGKGSFQGEQVPLDIYIMFDQSASMSCPVSTGSGGTRWDAVKGALTSFVQNAGATTISVGMGYFGTAASPPGSSCTPTDYKPDVEIGPLSVTAPAIINSLNNHNPLTDTPTLPALQSAISHAITWKAQNPGHTVVVVLVTDGQPNACGANTVDQIVQVADQGFTVGTIPTYVIGIVSPGTTCTYDPNKPTPADLDRVAKAGGTNASLIVDTTNTQQDPGAQFLATMNQIRQTAQIPCEYVIPAEQDGKPQDYFKVNLDFTDPTGKPGELYPAAIPPNKVGWDASKNCDKGGWYYDTDPNNQTTPPTKIILCPSTCTQLTATFGFSVTVILGCEPRPPPH